MSLPTVIIFRNGKGQELAALYHEYCGEIEDFGFALAEFLKDMVICKPYPKTGPFAYGMGDLAAQVVIHFRARWGHHIGLVPLPIAGDPWECIYSVVEKEGEARPLVELRYPWYEAPHFRGPAAQMIDWINMIKEGSIDKERAVVRVLTPPDAVDFDDRIPYMRSVEDKLGSNRCRGVLMSQALWKEYSNMDVTSRWEKPSIVACIGRQDDLELRIRQARAFAAVPSCSWISYGVEIIFWAEKWNNFKWNKYKGSFASSVMEIILKQVGKDPIDLMSGQPLKFRRDRTDFFHSATYDGYKIS